MRSNEVLTAILCTIAHLESVQAAPVADLSPIADKREPVNWVGIGEDALKGLTSGVTTTIGKDVGTEVVDGVESLASHFARAPERREPKKSSSSSSSSSSSGTKTNIGGTIINGIGSLAGGYLVDGAEDAWHAVESMVPRAPNEIRDATGLTVAPAPEKREPKKSSSSSSSGTKTNIGGTIINGIGSLAGGYLVDGAEDAWHAVESMVPRAPNEIRDAAGLTEEKRRSLWGTLGKDAMKGLGTGALKTVGEDAWEAVESMIPRAPVKRDAAGLTEEQRRSLWGTLGKDAMKGLGTGALKTVGEDAWEAVESMIPRAPGDMRDASGKLSTRTDDAPMAARSGIVGDIEDFGKKALPYVEEALPFAETAMDFLKREDGSSTNSAPMAARSGIVNDIEDFGKKALPYVEEALPYAEDALDFLKREAGSKTSDAPLAARSGAWDDILEGLGVAGKIGLGLLEDE